MGESCKECGRFTVKGQLENQAHHKLHPIYKTDFSKPLSQIIEDTRNALVRARGTLSDIEFAFPAWGERTANVSGLITCGIGSLYHIAEEMRRVEKRQAEIASEMNE